MTISELFSFSAGRKPIVKLKSDYYCLENNFKAVVNQPASLSCCCDSTYEQIQLANSDGTLLCNHIKDRGTREPQSVAAKNASATLKNDNGDICLNLDFHNFHKQRDGNNYICTCRYLNTNTEISRYSEESVLFKNFTENDDIIIEYFEGMDTGWITFSN